MPSLAPATAYRRRIIILYPLTGTSLKTHPRIPIHITKGTRLGPPPARPLGQQGRPIIHRRPCRQHPRGENQVADTTLRFNDVVKDYGEIRALHGLTFDIKEREFFTLLGPSGCGKTTLLRLIAGFEALSAGSIELRGKDLSPLPPAKRPVNTVFQHYALFPHLNVRDNIGFGLKMLGWDKARSAHRTQEMLELVKLSDLAMRLPAQLSGGQQQRVALARAMAPKPEVLLLDEPLSALDLKLRQAMRGELKQLQQRSKITFVFVTHDQEEALAMSDRIAVMSGGRIQQIGAPRSIYDEPVNAFVADFIGQSNVLGVEPAVGGWRLPGTRFVFDVVGKSHGERCQASIRPEQLSIIDGHDPSSGWCGAVSQSNYLGSGLDITVELDAGVTVQVRTPPSMTAPATVGRQVTVRPDAGAARLVD
ncbi:MAG: ABC transporter ATP-binding protein [Ectothiorhodospiraceae bacterium AqS1]|nr:ABC transporter ATP-binding protein [Ectothiorhodospiraceae bacterium AqS1]